MGARTHKADTVYLHVLKWENDLLRLPPIREDYRQQRTRRRRRNRQTGRRVHRGLRAENRSAGDRHHCSAETRRRRINEHYASIWVALHQAGKQRLRRTAVPRPVRNRDESRSEKAFRSHDLWRVAEKAVAAGIFRGGEGARSRPGSGSPRHTANAGVERPARLTPPCGHGHSGTTRTPTSDYGPRASTAQQSPPRWEAANPSKVRRPVRST